MTRVFVGSSARSEGVSAFERDKQPPVLSSGPAESRDSTRVRTLSKPHAGLCTGSGSDVEALRVHVDSVSYRRRGLSTVKISREIQWRKVRPARERPRANRDFPTSIHRDSSRRAAVEPGRVIVPSSHGDARDSDEMQIEKPR